MIKHLNRYLFDNKTEKIWYTIGRIVKNIQAMNHNIVVFQAGYTIIAENEIMNLILEDETSKGHKISRDQIIYDSVEISFEKALVDEENKNIFLRYIGELIALTIMNREEKIIVYSEYGKGNVFHATIYEDSRKFHRISVYKGFHYKPIIVNNNCCIIVEPRSKYFSEDNLRDLLPEFAEDEDFDRSIEKLCPIGNCEYQLKPFSLCDHGYPRSFGWLSDCILDQKRPSECDVNLEEYYKDPEKCPSQMFLSIMSKDPPVLSKVFNSDVDNPYSYPLELIRIVPNNNDAGSDGHALADEVIPRPFKRFKRTENYLDYLVCIKDLPNFQIIPDEFLCFNEELFTANEPKNPAYLIGNNKESQDPVRESRTQGYFKKCINLKFLVILSDKSVSKDSKFLQPLLGEKKPEEITYTSFVNIESLSYEIKYINDIGNFNDFIQKNKDNTFFILIHGEINDNKMIELKKALISNDLPNQSIRIPTLRKYGYNQFTNSIFYQIYHKSLGQTWVLKPSNEFELIGISTKFFNDHNSATILDFCNDGTFRRGFYLDEEKTIFKEVFQKILTKIIVKGIPSIILINGLILKEQLKDIQDTFHHEKDCIFSIFDTSLVRLFSMDRGGQVNDKPLKPGASVYIDNNYHIVTSWPPGGTQVCIRIEKQDSNISNDREIIKKIFYFTRFHPAYYRNSIKLPFPIHFSRAALKKCLAYSLKSFEFRTPFYL